MNINEIPVKDNESKNLVFKCKQAHYVITQLDKNFHKFLSLKNYVDNLLIGFINYFFQLLENIKNFDCNGLVLASSN